MEALSITSFRFSYPESEPTLDALDWTLEQGALALLVGDTGSGKTTLLRCLKPELAPTGLRKGTLKVFGEEVRELDPLESAQYIGYVGQDPDNQIVCDNVWHELAFGMENIGIEQNLMRRRVAETSYFFGMEPWIDQSTATLSGGQKQLVCLASVLALRPKIILLDEPTAQLDPVAEKNFLHALFRINRELGITIVVATHTPYAMSNYATSAFFLHDRKLQAISTESVSLLAGEQEKRFSSERRDPQSNDKPRPDISAQENKETDTSSPGTFASEEPDSENLLNDSPPYTIRLGEVYFGYERDRRPVLRNLSLAVREGSIHALVGGNGCGKSTLLRVIAGALRPQHGKVVNPYKAQQALLPQNPKALFVCDTLDEELREWQALSGYSDHDITRVVTLLHLENLLAHHPYDLSGGEQQLAAFAKVSLTHPQLLLLDEPTKGLDAHAKAVLAGQLVEFSRGGGTVILATHDLALVEQIADVVSFLFDGEIACTEPTGLFFVNNLFYRPEYPGMADDVNLAEPTAEDDGSADEPARHSVSPCAPHNAEQDACRVELQSCQETKSCSAGFPPPPPTPSPSDS